MKKYSVHNFWQYSPNQCTHNTVKKHILTMQLFMHATCPNGACGVVVIVVGNGHGDTSSNPGRDWLHFT